MQSKAQIGFAEPEVNICAVRKQVRSFSQIARTFECPLKALPGRLQIAAHQGLPSKRHLSPYILLHDKSFAAFPRLEKSCHDQLARLLMLTALIIKSDKFNREVVTSVDKISTALKLELTLSL